MRTHNIPSYKRKSKIYPYYASSPGAMINTYKLELLLSRAYVMVPKVFEPLKFYCTCVTGDQEDSTVPIAGVVVPVVLVIIGSACALGAIIIYRR